jgi:ElaB/YqjD/DUF883 family membrane-anchored ribosome-binding protein
MENNHHSTKKFEDALHLLNEAAREKKEEIQSLIGDKYSQLRDVIEETATKGRKDFRRAKKTAENWLDENSEGLRETVADLDERVHENPWAYVGGVAAGALLLGFILGSSSRNR